MADDLNYANVVDHLLIAVPELRPEYERVLKEWHGEIPEAYAYYGPIFVPYIVALSKKIRKPDKLQALIRAMVPLEVLSAHSDYEVRCLSKVGVLEQLFGTKGRMEALAHYMGPETRRLAIEYGVTMLFKVDWIRQLPPSQHVN